MPTSSFLKDFVIKSDKVAKRLLKVLEEKNAGNEDYKKIDINAELEKGRLLAKEYFSHNKEKK